VNFLSDNAAGVSSKIMDAVVDACEGTSRPYGADQETKHAVDLLRQTFECELSAYLVTTGTAANALALGAATMAWGAIFCHEHAHVMSDECGAPEMFTGGAKLIGLPGERGKVSVGALHERLSRLKAAPGQTPRPSVLSLAQTNEFGAVYTVPELQALTSRAHAEGMTVHMDGARFANAVVALNKTPAELTWKAGVDVLSFGVSKNGGIACEAVIFFDQALALEFQRQRKRAGHSLAKGRFLGAQMAAYLHDEHWLESATRANQQAARLAAGLSEAPGVRLPWARDANLVFAIIPRRLNQKLRDSGAEYYEWPHQGLGLALAQNELFVRLATSFATTPDEVDCFVAVAMTSAAGNVRRNTDWREDRASA
jgi:threonine aldolase